MAIEINIPKPEYTPEEIGAENVVNKKTTLEENSDTFYPTQKAVKTAVDAKQDNLGYTPENSANKATTVTGNETSNEKFGTIKAIVDYVGSAVSWIATNGANVLAHLTNTSNPHSVTATQVDALKRDGSNANSDVDLGSYSINAKSVNVKGTGGNGHLGLKHQSADATATGSETVIFAGSDGEPRYKNDGGTVAQFASRAWVTAQGYITNVITALGYTPVPNTRTINGYDLSANRTLTASDVSAVASNSAITGATKTKITYDSKGLVTSGADATTADIADSTNKRYVTDAQLTVIGNTSNTNTGDETQATIISKLGYTPYDSTNPSGYITSSALSPYLTSVTAAATYQTILPAASALANGYLTSTDWSTFNNKRNNTTATTGAVVDFATSQIYNSVASPATGNITDNLTGANIGIVQKIYHNDSVSPTFPAGWVKLGSGSYTTSSLNIIFAEWVSGTRVEYWIVKGS